MSEKCVTDIIEEVKKEMCNNFCKHTEECWKAIEEGKEYPCPLDKL